MRVLAREKMGLYEDREMNGLICFLLLAGGT